MKAQLLLLASCLAALALLPAATAQDASAVLTGENQNPPIDTATVATWNATLDGNRMDWVLEVLNADRITMAHIHQGGPNVNGPVIVGLVPVGANVQGEQLPQLEQPASGDQMYMGTFTPAEFAGPLQGMTMQDLVSLFRNNQAYVNVHSVEFPDGIVRGQVELM